MVRERKKFPRPYQFEDLKVYLVNLRCLNRSEPATGKTGSACLYVECLWTTNNQRTIWVNTGSILAKNKKELIDFTQLDEDKLRLWDSKMTEETLKDTICLFITADSFREHYQFIVDTMKPELLIGDEVHLYWATHGEVTYKRTSEGFKTVVKGSARTLAMYQALRYIPRFLAMSGTIVKGRLSSAYPIIRAIMPNIYPSYKAFLSQHEIRDPYNPRKVIGWRGHDRIKMILDCMSINRTFESIYGKENKVVIPTLVDMTPEHRKIYSQFHAEAAIELEDETLYTSKLEVHTLRCRQIMGHPHCVEGKEFIPRKNLLGKDLWLIDNVELNSPTIIFAAFVEEQVKIKEILEQELGKKVAILNGSTSQNQRQKIDEDFQSGELDYIVGSPICAGVGLNWHRAEKVIFYSSDYMDDSFIQAYRRAIRGERDTPLLIYVLQYMDSIEYKILRRMENKSKDANLVDSTREVLKLVA